MWMAMVVLLVALCLGAAGQVCLKAGLRALGADPPIGAVLASIVTNRLVLGGFACYGLSSLLYLVALSRLDLSYAYPLVALTYVIVTVLAWRLLGETVPLGRMIGLAIICVGVVVVASSHSGSQSTSALGPGPEQAVTDSLPGQD